MQTARADAVRDFKATQSFINFCAGYYGTGFDDCLKQVASTFLELDLSGITMDDGDDSPSYSTPTPEPDGVVILAQPAKLEEANRQNDKLREKVTALGQRV